MDGSRESHTEWSKSDRDGEISYDIPYIWTLERNDTDEPSYKTEADSWLLWGGIVKNFGKVRYTLLYLKWTANKNLL